MGFSRQEHWSGLPFPPSGDLPHPGIEPVSPTLAGIFFTTEPPGKPVSNLQIVLKDCCSDQDKRGSSPQRTNTKVLAPPGDFRELRCNSKFHPEGTGFCSQEKESVLFLRDPRLPPHLSPAPFTPLLPPSPRLPLFISGFSAEVCPLLDLSCLLSFPTGQVFKHSSQNHQHQKQLHPYSRLLL